MVENQIHDQRKAVLCLFSGDIGLFFPPKKRRKKKPLLYNLKTRLFIYLQCKGTVQGPTLTAVSGVAPPHKALTASFSHCCLGISSTKAVCAIAC